MNRSDGLLLVILWCLLRGIFGTYGAIRLGSAVGHVSSLTWRHLTWRHVAFVFLVEGAIWLWLSFALLSRWNVARWAAVLWCGITIAWSSYGFYTAALPRWNQFRYGGIYILTVAIHAAIIIYLLRPAVGSLFRQPERSAA